MPSSLDDALGAASVSSVGARDADGYADLDRYGVLGDGRSVALVAADGSVDWWAVPRLDAAPVCAALLDPVRGGRIRLAPLDPEAEGRMAYVPGTNLLQTVWTSADGAVRVTDSLNSGNAGALPWTELGRRVEGLRGVVELALVVEAGNGLGAWQPWLRDDRADLVVHAGSTVLGIRVPSGVQVLRDDPAVTCRLRVRGGERLTTAVVASDGAPLFLVSPSDVDARIDLTAASWRRWSDQLAQGGPRGRAVTRSGLALKTVVMAGTGAIAAAATTSLPERTGGPKNWDYRDAWVRDAALTIRALAACGLQEEVHAAITWLLDTIRAGGHSLRSMYTLDGRTPQGQSDLDAPGWRHSAPVRSGNRAASQLQLGVYGELFDTVASWVFRGHVLDLRTSRELADLADACADMWLRGDSGIWELPEERPYTSSKMNCWRALDAAARLGEAGHLEGPASRWRREAERVRTWVEQHCWSDGAGAYTAWAGSEELDASVLLGATYGFDRGPRMSSTIDALGRRLGVGPLLHRYTGAETEEATFLACAYWRVTALDHVGRPAEAESLMAALDDLTGPLGLMSEMVSADGRRMLGNLPQALSHLSHIEAALQLDPIVPEDDEQKEEHP